MAQEFAQRVRDDPVARNLWYLTENETVDLWLLTQHVSAAAERALHGVALEVNDHFPDLLVNLHVVNPASFAEASAEEAVPSFAELVAFL